MVLIHSCFAYMIGYYLWLRFDDTPMENIIEQIHYPPTNLSFPAVTICPVNSINFTAGLRILNRHLEKCGLNGSNVDFTNFLKALTAMKYPTYFNMKKHLELSKDQWHLFKTLNLTEFLIQVRPSCSDVLDECYWEGVRINCCDVFSVQRTEQGFCYTFNSITAEHFCECPLASDMVYNSQQRTTFCNVHRSRSTGSFSGLTVVLKEDRFNSHDDPTHPDEAIRGVLVLISGSCELPEAGSGVLLETSLGHMLGVEVTPMLYEADATIKSIDKEERRCVFSSERHLKLISFYSEHNCLLECRHHYITKACKCQPPIYFDPGVPYPICDVSRLICISSLSIHGKLRRRNPYEIIPTDGDIPDCNCLPACHRLLFDLRYRRNILTSFSGKKRYGILDVHYSGLGAIKYKTQLSFTVEGLMTSVGGTGNLLLGASMISGAELMYNIIRGVTKLLRIAVKTYTARKIPRHVQFIQ